jgi:MoaA/NifB/PqqE/SkfB family radical SAM enzyme
MSLPYSQLRFNARLPLAERLPLPSPLSVYVETINICNFKCTQCPVSQPNYFELVGGKARLDRDTYSRFLDDLRSMGGVVSLKFYGEGEPLSNPDLPEMISAAHEAGVCQRSEVTSNGSLMSESLAEKLVLSGLSYIRFSIYGLSDAEHRDRTGSRVSVDRILQNI